MKIALAWLSYFALVTLSRWIARDIDLIDWILSVVTFSAAIAISSWAFDEWQRRGLRIRSPFEQERKAK